MGDTVPGSDAWYAGHEKRIHSKSGLSGLWCLSDRVYHDLIHSCERR
jgi:hypothetical protein